MLAYTVIHGCDPSRERSWRFCRRTPKASPEWRMWVNKLRQEINQKKTGW